MNIAELKDKWESAADDMERAEIFSEIKIEKYISLMKKRYAIEVILDSVSEDGIVFANYDSIDVYFYFIVAAVGLYTDLSFSDDEIESEKELDFLIKEGIWGMITEKVGTDLDDFLEFLKQRINDRLRVDGVGTILAQILYSTVDSFTNISENINPENKEAIKEMLKGSVIDGSGRTH